MIHEFVPTVTASTATSLEAIINWMPAMYVHLESPAERYMRLSNILADCCDVRMSMGQHEEMFIDLAEASDALAVLARMCAVVA